MTGCFRALTLQGTCATLLLSRYKSKEPAGHPFPPHQPFQPSLQLYSTGFPATCATSALLLQGSCCCVALRQCRTVQMLLFLCSHFPSWVCVSAVGGEEILSTSSEGSSWTRATRPSANTVCKMLLLGAIPAPLTLSSPPCQLQLLYRFSLQSTLLQLREKLPPFTLPSTPPPRFQQRCHPPSHHRVLLTLSH